MQILEDFDLAALTTFAVPARARAFVEITDERELIPALEYAQDEQLSLLILGGGSNILFTDDYPGLVVHMAIPGIAVDPGAGERHRLRVGAGENWHRFVMFCLKHGFYGIENLVLIPGTVGAAPMQNIGAYGVELADVFVELTALEVNSGDIWTFDRSDCRFGYRDSVFKHGRPGELIITSVTLELHGEPAVNASYGALQEELAARDASSAPAPADVAAAVMAIRRRKLPDPAVLPNCGSFFKNPVIDAGIRDALRERFDQMPEFPVADGKPGQVKVPAAWLLDQAGWKGKRRGALGVHREQAVVIVNYGGATGAQVVSLARDMQQSVMDGFGITLEPEVRII